MTDPYPKEGMEALVKERAIFKLDQKVAKREALRAKLKLQREVIEKRMRSEPVAGAPFPKDCVDKLKSNNVLEKILLCLTDPVDVISAYNACSTFNDILESKRKAILLPEVLKIFFDQKFGFKHESAFREILGLRLVSKSWRNEVDKYLYGEEDNTGCEWYFEQTYQDRGRSLKYCRTLRLDTTTGINRAISVLSMMPDSDRKLFAGRVHVGAVFNGEPDPVRLNEFYAGVSEFLEKFGDSVWDFNLYLEDIPPNKFYELMHYWTTLMPGLKRLNVTTDHRLLYDDDDDEDFSRRVRQLPFPSLPLLREFHWGSGLSWYEGWHIPILTEIIRANSWIRKTNRTFGELMPENLPASFKPASMDITITDLVPQSSLVSWPLKEVVLTLGLDDETEFLKVFPLLETFKETLTILDIYNYFPKHDHEWPYLNLPNLKTLTMNYDAQNPSLDFLLPMKALENLYLRCCFLFNRRKSYREVRRAMFCFDETEKIKFKGLLLQMEDSNITQVFPFLQKMVFRSWNHDGPPRVRYLREADVMKLHKKDENILMNIRKQVDETG